LPFNLASSGSVATVAIDLSGREIGVDVELINTSFSYWNFAGYYFSIQECDRIFNHRDYFRHITQKEALLKATGVRVVGDATKIDLSSPVSRIPVTDERLLPYKQTRFTMYTLEDEMAVLTLAVPAADIGQQQPGRMRMTEVQFQ
jgi:phosphopantetheinyl transferase